MLTEVHNLMKMITAESTDTDQLKIMEQRKKTRRGKKSSAKHRFVEDLLSQNMDSQSAESIRVPDCSCGSPPTRGYKPYKRTTPSPQKPTRKAKKGILRPSYSPKAPHNDNQFLIEDHLGNNYEENFNLKMLFVDDFFPHCLGAGPKSSPDSPDKDWYTENISESEFSPTYEPKSNSSSPFKDFDFEYSFGEEDHDSRFNFYEKDFDDFYKTSREAELATLSRSDLIQSVVSMEKRLSSLEQREEPSREPSPEDSLQKLMTELKMLKEENQRLKEESAISV